MMLLPVKNYSLIHSITHRTGDPVKIDTHAKI